MLRMILGLYLSLLPVILAGSFNMKFCSSKYFESLNFPIDKGYSLNDGKRILGKNKTYKGFLGMVVITSLLQVLLGWLSQLFQNLELLNVYYRVHDNLLFTNIWLGGLLGLAYVLFELPNSLLKRRFDTEPGMGAPEKYFWTFFLLDQIDSLIGIILVSRLITNISRLEGMLILILGSITHIIVNLILYRLNWRQNPF